MERDYKVDYRNIVNDKDGVAEYVTVFEDNKPPLWYKITHDSNGAYINFYDKKLYIFENTGG